MGIDTATYDQAIDDLHVATNGSGGWTVTTGGVEGTDTLINVERIDGAGAGKILLVGAGGFSRSRRPGRRGRRRHDPGGGGYL